MCGGISSLQETKKIQSSPLTRSSFDGIPGKLGTLATPEPEASAENDALLLFIGASICSSSSDSDSTTITIVRAEEIRQNSRKCQTHQTLSHSNIFRVVHKEEISITVWSVGFLFSTTNNEQTGKQLTFTFAFI